MIEAATVEPSADELRVLLLVPTRKDASVATRLLAEGKLSAATCASMKELVEEIERGAAAIMTTEELMDEERVNRLVGILAAQRDWSDLPVVVLMRGGVESAKAVTVLSRLTNVTILERNAPLRSVLSAVQAAVRGRRRQYQMRSQLQVIQNAEAKAQRSERAKDDFLAALSHELRTPLNPVLLLATELAGDTTLPPAVRADFDLIAKNVNLEARLIDDLLDLTRITRDKVKLETTHLEVGRLMQDALATVAADFKQKSLSISTEFADQGAIVEGDPVRLQQVLWNVLKNAAKFTPEGGRVSIKTSLPADSARVQMEIRDSGVGMSPEEIGGIFEAFAQGDHAANGSRHRFGGLGLGLAISRSLIRLHHGEITASSSGLGAGAVFTITLPLASSQAPVRSVTSPHAATTTATPTFCLRILLVEDHEPTRAILTKLMQRRFHEVRSAGSVEEARRVAATFTFDLLMTDLGLPDGSGYDLMEEFRARKGMIGVALSGYGMEDDVQRSEEVGFTSHLTKPIPMATLDRFLAMVVTRLHKE